MDKKVYSDKYMLKLKLNNVDKIKMHLLKILFLNQLLVSHIERTKTFVKGSPKSKYPLFLKPYLHLHTRYLIHIQERAKHWFLYTVSVYSVGLLALNTSSY